MQCSRAGEWAGRSRQPAKHSNEKSSGAGPAAAPRAPSLNRSRTVLLNHTSYACVKPMRQQPLVHPFKALAHRSSMLVRQKKRGNGSTNILNYSVLLHIICDQPRYKRYLGGSMFTTSSHKMWNYVVNQVYEQKVS